MKPSIAKLAEAVRTPVFQKQLHRLRLGPGAALQAQSFQKQDIFLSKSRDTRADRGARQMKATHHSQTLPPVLRFFIRKTSPVKGGCPVFLNTY